MTLPGSDILSKTLEVTWPARSLRYAGDWCIRDGGGGGKRVSAATQLSASDHPDIPGAEAAMRDLGQPALFMIREGDERLDQQLAERGYHIIDPVTFYAIPVENLTSTPIPPVTAFSIWEPLAVQKEIWAEGGIGTDRLNVMHRAASPKTTLLGRCNGRAAGTAFVAMGGPVGMIHALEVRAAFRQRGMATHLTRMAAYWAEAQGATHLSLATTRANAAANALYSGLGFQLVGQYHYRIHLEDTA